MSLETFDWKGYLQYIGYPEDQIPDSVSDQELLDIRRHWAQTVYQEELAAAQDDPFLETPKERREYARDVLLAAAPEFRSEFGLRDPQPAERAFSAQEFHDWVVNNEYQDGNLDFYLKTFAASRINKNTKYEYPYLEGLTKKEFQDMFMEQNGIDPDLTTIEDIRNGNFGPAAMARRAEEESNLPKGSAMRQGWLEFKKLTGLTTETFGDFLGVEWMRNIGRGITENAIKTIDEEGYRGKYQESLVDTVKNEGIFAGAGKVLQMAQENWATTGIPLALAGMSAMFGVASRNPRLAAQSLASARASLAAATSADVAMGTGAAATVGRVGASTIAKSLAFASAMASGLEVGAVREELEQKGKEEGRQLYDPNDPGDAVAWGLLSAALDHIGNMATFVGGGGLIRAAKGLTQAQQTRALEAASAAARQAAREAGKSWGRKIVEAMGVEGITESLQELPSIMAARNKGVEYTPKEIRDRMIDAGVVGAFMGGGMRTVQSIPETLRERGRRTQSESETTQTPAAPTPQTNVPPAPNQPPPVGFDEKLAWNTNFAEIDNGNGWAAWDGYNVGYGKTKEEASQALLDQSNANKDQISGTPTSTANESRVSFGNGGELVVTGNGHQGVIKRIIDLHNSNDNYISLDGTRTHTFDATALSGLNEKDFRKYISQNWGNTTLQDTRGVRQARVDQVDIGINFDAEIRDNNGNVIGRRAELDLDNYRDQLEAKGYRIIASRFSGNGNVQTVQLFRDGQLYRIELTTNGNDVTSTIFSKGILGNYEGRVESELSVQRHRVTDVGGAARVLNNVLSIAPAIRAGGVQIERDAAGTDAKFVNRKALEDFVKKQGGKIDKIGERSITYEFGGETMKLDLQANGDVLVSRNGRFLGSYQFDGSDIGNGVQRATYDLINNVTSSPRFSDRDVWQEMGYARKAGGRRNVLIVYDNERNEYYIIKVSKNGNVTTAMIPRDPNGFFARLEALQNMRTIEDVRFVYGSQFRTGYVEMVTDANGIYGMRSRTTGLATDDINDVQFLTDDEIDDIINNSANPSYNPDFMRNVVKVVGVSQYVSSTTTTSARIVDWVTVDDPSQVAGFIERAKGYGAMIADYDSMGSNISELGKAWNAPGEITADAGGLGLTDLYEGDYLNFEPDAYIDALEQQSTASARLSIEEDIKKVAKATRKAFQDMRDLLSRSSAYLPSITTYDIQALENSYRSVFNRRLRNITNTAIKAKDIRRHFYRARLLQAKLHMEVLASDPEFYGNRIIDNTIRNTAYDPNWGNDELRLAVAEAEEFVLRLEEEFISLRDMQNSASFTRQIWDSLYPGQGAMYGSFIERIHNQGRDFRFSRDVNAGRAKRNISILDELSRHPFLGQGALNDLIESGKLVILSTQQEIESALIRERGYAPHFSELGNIQGFASNDNQRVYLSEWGIKQGDAFRVLLHEFGIHAKYLGFTQAQFQEILAGIRQNATAQTPEGRWIRLAIQKVESTNMKRNNPYFWEEVAAYLVEHSNEYAGLGILDQMQAWVKRWLFTNGYIDATNFHYQDFAIFSLGMLKDSRIPFRLMNGKFDYSKHQMGIYDARKFVEDYITDDLVNELGYSREELRELMAAHLVGTYKNIHVLGDLPDEEEFASRFPGMDAAWAEYRRDRSLDDSRFSRDIETALNERINTDFIPQGMQKEAGVRYPNMGEEISNFRYSIGKKAREEYRAQLERGREDLSPDEIENILKELDKYHDAKNNKKVRAALHWTITGKVILPEDEYKVDDAIKLAENKKIDLISNLKKYESPLDFINEYLESRPEGAPIRPEQLEEKFPGIFTEFENHGDGIVSYQVQDTKEGQQAMREIINTHLGKDQSPWCLLYADAQGRLQDRAWKWWSETYTGLPKRVAFKNGNLISFMATSPPIKHPGISLDDEIKQIRDYLSTNLGLYNYEVVTKESRGSAYSYDIEKNINTIRGVFRGYYYGWEDQIDLEAFAYMEKYIPDEIYNKVYNHVSNVQKKRNKLISRVVRYFPDVNKYGKILEEAANKAIEDVKRERVEIVEKWQDFVRTAEIIVNYEDNNRIATIRTFAGLPIENLGNFFTRFYFNDETGKYFSNDVGSKNPIPEQWWDINDQSHPNLDWARDPSVGRLRYSIAGEIGEQEMLLPEGTIRFSHRDVAKLTYDFGNFKDISLQQFSERFQKYIEGRDKTIEDVERICADYIENVRRNPAYFVPQLDPRKRNYLRYFFIENGESRGQLYDNTNPKHNRDASDQQHQVIALYRQSLSEEDFNRLYKLLSIPRNEQTKEQKDEIAALDSRARFGDLSKEEVDRLSELFITLDEKEEEYDEFYDPMGDEDNELGEFSLSEEEFRKERERIKEFSELKDRITNFGNGILDEIEIINNERNKAIQSLAQYFDGNSDYHSSEKALILWGAMRYAITERMVNNDKLEVKLWKLSDDNDARVMVVPGEWTAKIVDHLRRGASYEDALIKASKEMKEINAAKRGVPVGFTGWKVYEQNDSYEAGQELQQAVAGTGWCTGASVDTAQMHRKGGDFHVYFENGNPTIAIRTENGRMAEPPRGAHEGQFCTPEEEAIAEEYIRTGGKIAAGDDYLKDREDIRRVASGEMTWQEAFMIPAQRRYANGEFGGDTKAWPEGVRIAINDILERHREERIAAGWYYMDELRGNDNEKVVVLRVDDDILSIDYPNLTTIVGKVNIKNGFIGPKLVSIEGHLRLTLSEKVHIPQLKNISGNLIVAEGYGVIPELISIGGRLAFDFLNFKGDIIFPKLTSIGKDANIEKKVKLPKLTTIGESANIYGSVPNLTTIGGYVRIYNDIPKLKTVGGSLYFFIPISLPNLTTIGGDVTINENINANSLTTIGGDATIDGGVNVPSLTTIGGNARIYENINANSLTTVNGNLMIDMSANVPSLTTVEGKITVFNHGVVSNINTFRELQRSRGVRYSIAQQPTTVEQGAAIPNAPGMYKMRDGSIQVQSEEVPLGRETETAIYAAVVLSEPAKNDPGIVDLREMVAADEVLREQVLTELSARGIEDNPDNEFVFGIRNVLQTREPENPTYQAIVDVFHDVITKATGGVQDDILLTDNDIAAAAHAITNTPFEPLLGEPVPTAPTPRETVFDKIEREYRMIEDRHRDIVENLIEVDENTGAVRFSIANCEVFLDGNFRDTATDRHKQEFYAELERIHGTTHQYGEADGFYNQLASAQMTGTQEVRDYGALAQPADANRALVEDFIRRLNPEIYDKIQIEWVNTPDANTNLAGGLASFNPVGRGANKLIYIQGWGRTAGQVIRSAAWEASRFGWNSGIISNLKAPLARFYDLHESAIYQELSPYYTKYGITRGNVGDEHKVFLVQSYFAKMNQNILTGNPNALANAIGIDPATYKRIHDEVQNNVNTAVRDITDYIDRSGSISTDPEIAKAFAQDILRIVMGGMNGRGASFVYKTNGTGVSDTIYCYTNDFGLHRKPRLPADDENRHAHVAREIKENIEWWRKTFEPFGLGELAANFCKFFLRNFPMHNGLSFLHLNVPHARLGDSTITRATNLISRIWQRVDDPHGIEIRRNIAVMEKVQAILRDHHYDARWTQNATGGYEALFRSLGITDEKSLATAKLADHALPGMLAMIRENAGAIRDEFASTIDSLIRYMEAGGVPAHEIDRMSERMNAYAESFIDDYEHRSYEVYTTDGLDELVAMQHDLNIDPTTGEMGIYAKARQARRFISDTEARLHGRNAEFYRKTEEARKIVRRLERLESLRKYKEGKLLQARSPLRGAELQEAVIKQMNDEIAARIKDIQDLKVEGRGSYKKFNYIPGSKRRKLDERLELDREYMNFLGRIEDPLMNAIYSIDQQRKIIEKLFFNRELGEHILSTGMGTISGSVVSTPVGAGTVGDLTNMENGTFLQYVNVDPIFLKEINNEYMLNSRVRDSVLGGVIDVWKANNTIYSIKLGINNYVGNFSMLLASGHLWRYANWISAGQITKRQFLERFTDNLKDLDQFSEQVYKEMRDNRVVGGTMSEMNVMTYGRGHHEKILSMFLRHLRDANILSNQGTFRTEEWVNNFLEKMKLTYAFGDEWVKPLMYLNNRANAIAKYESKLNPNDPRFAGDPEMWRDEVKRLAIQEAAEQTIRESVSWENSPQLIRALSQQNLRIFTPDFLMHNFQMVRITASNFMRLGECIRELSTLEVNNERDAKYQDALIKEIAQRSVGGAMTTATYAMLMGAAGSVMALVPYMFNVLFKSIEGEDGDDEEKGMFFDPQEWEGAQRLMNYKTGGNNLFVPVFRKDNKIYAWNYVRSSVMLTHAPVMPPTENPDLVDYGVIMFRNFVDLSNGTMTQQLINNMMGRDRWGREIGTLAGWGQVIERTMVPGFARQLAGVTLGYPLTDNLYHQGRLIKIPDLLGITVNEYDPRDIANQLAFDITAHNSNGKNVARRNFMERLLKGERLDDRQLVGMINDMRTKNAEEFGKANYVLTGLRQIGMTDKELMQWLTVSRKGGGDALGRKQAADFLKGKEIYDYALITSMINQRKNLIEEGKKIRMSEEELAVAVGNFDRAIRMYKQSLRQ